MCTCKKFTNYKLPNLYPKLTLCFKKKPMAELYYKDFGYVYVCGKFIDSAVAKFFLFTHTEPHAVGNIGPRKSCEMTCRCFSKK